MELPQGGENVDFDDTVYTADLDRVLIPARSEGIYLVDPATAQATRVDYPGAVDSVDAGDGGLFALDRSGRVIHVLDPEGQLKSSVATGGGPDYLRYVAAEKELWISEPGVEGIEVFTLQDSLELAPRRSGFIPVPGGVEGLTFSADGSRAYTHAGNDLVVLDVPAHREAARWPTGCNGTHGSPRIDQDGTFVLASCAKDGKVTLLDAADGHQLGAYEVGGGESLPGHSAEQDYFYVRSDPGSTLAVLDASRESLQEVRTVKVPEVGHCLGAQGNHYWTCDAAAGGVLLFQDG
ncbi:YncE family protein [Kocuria dechangensis]|uniref:YncE family protein n=1 Tax=Kocuria dechangensis TaxID=1176249 RepID=UPI00166E8B19|nr:hypothetical protein [Kocuria dechangensis]